MIIFLHFRNLLFFISPFREDRFNSAYLFLSEAELISNDLQFCSRNVIFENILFEGFLNLSEAVKSKSDFDPI